MDLVGTWVHVGSGEVINIDAHIDHLTGLNLIDLSDDASSEQFKWAILKMLEELRRRVLAEGK